MWSGGYSVDLRRHDWLRQRREYDKNHRLDKFVGLVQLIFEHEFCAFDHILRGQPDKRKFRDEQHPELGNQRRNDNFDFSWQLQFLIGERFNQRKPHGDDNLHADRHQCHWISELNGNCHGDHGKRRDAGQFNDHYLVVSQRNPGSLVCGLHNFRKRWHPALYIFSEYEPELSTTT